MQNMDIGIIGLGVMGENLALNLERHGLGVAGFDLDSAKRDSFTQRAAGLHATAQASLAELVGRLKLPRRVMLMVPAGAAVDRVLVELRLLLSPGDVIIDGGNSLYTDTRRRIQSLEGTGLLYVGSGVSGGEEGALNGPALMPGGSPQAWPLIKPMLQAIAARGPDGVACCEWMGPDGAGHFVKMVHNGIEYADMQMIGESYSLMRQLLGLTPKQMSAIYREWNNSDLESYLIGITADILDHVDDQTGAATVDLILDTAEQKGTGKWASQVALDMGVTAPTIAEAVFARTISALQPERVVASKVLKGPVGAPSAGGEALVGQLRGALLAAKICAYAQGFALMRAADQEFGWQLPMASIASIWRAGCIIRARLLDDIRQAYTVQPALVNLLVAPGLAATLAQTQQDLRTVVSVAAQHGVAIPAFMSALSYYDGYRSSRLSANLLQAQRDYFGAHTYRRVDMPGKFHTRWTVS